MEKVNEIKVHIPAGCKATTEIKDGIMTVLIEKEKQKKEWKLIEQREYCWSDGENDFVLVKKEIKDDIMTVLIEKEKVKKEWKLIENKKYYYITENSTIKYTNYFTVNHKQNRNLFRHESDAKAMLAYIQLLEMYYQEVGDYVPDWNMVVEKHCITRLRSEIVILEVYSCDEVFSFPARKQAEQFLSDYSELIEQAKRFL